MKNEYSVTERVAFIIYFIAAIVVIFTFYVNLVHGQEGCGEWVHPERTGYRCGRFHPDTLWEYGFDDPIDSVWIPKSCPEEPAGPCGPIGPDTFGDAVIYMVRGDTSTSPSLHILLEVWDKQPCNPGMEDKLWYPISRLDSSIVREDICHEDYYNHVLRYFPCYCLIFDGVRYWTRENPLDILKGGKE